MDDNYIMTDAEVKWAQGMITRSTAVKLSAERIIDELTTRLVKSGEAKLRLQREEENVVPQ
jgi:hypothetical protein